MYKVLSRTEISLAVSCMCIMQESTRRIRLPIFDSTYRKYFNDIKCNDCPKDADATATTATSVMVESLMQ